MKKTLNILVIAAATLMLASCSDKWLQPESKTNILEADYYNSADRLFTGLVAAYDPLKWYDYFYQYNSLNMVSDIMADDILCGGSNDSDQPTLVKAHYYTLTPADQPNQIWTICYSGVNRANIVIAKAPSIEMDETTKALYVAEAKVLKCWYYNILWKYWGNIPYYDENLTFPYSCEQIGHDEVYAKVIATLEGVIDSDVLPMKAAIGDEGRVTQAMAKMLYAEMVMYQNDDTRYSKALGYMQDIIKSTKYSLASDFAGIWLESGEWCDESIWEINYISEGGIRDWGAPIATGGSVYPVLIGIPGVTGNDFVDGWGFSPVAKKAYDMYSANDTRRDGGILNFADYAAKTGNTYVPRWESTGYFLLKYLARKGGNHGYVASDNLNYGNNQRIYRYSETLLNAAELLLRTNGSSTDATNYLNEVRERAKVSDETATIDNIIEERHLEFVGEGKRYWDLVRTGKAATVLVAGDPAGRTASWTENKKYWPIPQSEIDKSATTLTQNNY
jgi:hypothetical protein